MTGAKQGRLAAGVGVVAASLAIVGIGAAVVSHSLSAVGTATLAASTPPPSSNPWTLAQESLGSSSAKAVPASPSESAAQNSPAPARTSPYPSSQPPDPAQTAPPQQVPTLPQVAATAKGPAYAPAPQPTCPPDKGVTLTVIGVKKLGPGGGNLYEATLAIDNHFDIPLEVMTLPLVIDTVFGGGGETRVGEFVISGDYGPGRTTISDVINGTSGLGTSFVIPQQAISIRSIPGLGSSQLYCTYKPVMGPPYTGPIG